MSEFRNCEHAEEVATEGEIELHNLQARMERETFTDKEWKTVSGREESLARTVSDAYHYLMQNCYPCPHCNGTGWIHGGAECAFCGGKGTQP